MHFISLHLLSLFKLCGALLLLSIMVALPVYANQTTLKQAEHALSTKDYQQAHHLFESLTAQPALLNQALFGLAKTALYRNNLDKAEHYINSLIAKTKPHPEYLFIAGRIAGAKAQTANIFTKLGYARNARKYFTNALSIDPTHQPSIIGLIRFHQQAPVMAGGDKATIPELVNQLRLLDPIAAFELELPKLLDQQTIASVLTQYQALLVAPSTKDIEKFKFEFAMQLSYRGYYEQALEEFIAIDVSKSSKAHEFATMRLYQIGKMAAESNTKLDIGLKYMEQYANAPENDKTIADDWVAFRLTQLSYLKNNDSGSKMTIAKLGKHTEDNDLKHKISAFLNKLNS